MNVGVQRHKANKHTSNRIAQKGAPNPPKNQPKTQLPTLNPIRVFGGRGCDCCLSALGGQQLCGAQLWLTSPSQRGRLGEGLTSAGGNWHRSMDVSCHSSPFFKLFLSNFVLNAAL